MIDFLHDIIDFLLGFFKEGTDVVDKIIGAFFIICALFVTGLILWLGYELVGWLIRMVDWYRHRRPCVHCNQWTLAYSEGRFPSECQDGQPCCTTCAHGHEMANEGKYACPVCGTTMEKRSIDDIHTEDVCPKQGCGHILRSPEEDSYVRQSEYDSGYSAGRATGTATGVGIGIAIS